MPVMDGVGMANFKKFQAYFLLDLELQMEKNNAAEYSAWKELIPKS